MGETMNRQKAYVPTFYSDYITKELSNAGLVEDYERELLCDYLSQEEQQGVRYVF